MIPLRLNSHVFIHHSLLMPMQKHWLKDLKVNVHYYFHPKISFVKRKEPNPLEETLEEMGYMYNSLEHFN